jgi:hypothetical protein
MYWQVFIRGLWVCGALGGNPQHRPPISIDDTLEGYAVLEKARTLADLFGNERDPHGPVFEATP